MGSQLKLPREARGSFLEYLKSLGGKRMCEFIKEGETDIS
jgi:hypothetical protein